MYAEKNIPKFSWLRIHGKAGQDDFGISGDNRLVVSEKIMRILNRFRLANCDAEKYIKEIEEDSCKLPDSSDRLVENALPI